MKNEKSQWFWFIGGFAVGLTILTLSHAAVDKSAERKAAPITELKAEKIETPELEDDFSQLSQMEARFSESAAQQQKLRAVVGSGKTRVRN